MKGLSREDIAKIILNKISENFQELKAMYKSSKNGIGHFYLDNVLPVDLAIKCHKAFPNKSEMIKKKSLREYKYVSAQMNEHPSILEDVLYAFQNEKVVNKIGEICSVKSLYPDENLYAGGISLMERDNFLHPHLDNSHDSERDRWRVLNLLYYVSPNWDRNHGGHLELWPQGPKEEPILIESQFNRLVLMATHGDSWHSVNKVIANKNRCCISNYYFSDNPLRESDAFHVTSFRGRPKSKAIDLVLTIDSELRMFLRKLFKKGITKNPHIYKKDKIE